MDVGIQDSPEQVLSTMTTDGKRVWLRPRLSKGRFLTARRMVAYLLMVLFFALPFGHVAMGWLGVRAKQFILLDIVARRFTILGYTFLPTDTVLLALFMLIVFVGIFLFTALLGRLWCGWACPQTVYMEFLYRPLERLLDGTFGKGGPAKKGIGGWRQPAYFVVALIVSLIPAHTFLAYFVPAEKLMAWVHGNPLIHPTAFIVMGITTLLMMFDFYFFREQLCLIACPYGRFQSVLLDKWSMIVSYDSRRGEPRGKLKGKGERGEGKGSDVALTVLGEDTLKRELRTEPRTGDCVDCGLCVTTCPTGIDIRAGLQMECVSCTQCIDACDAVMEKIGRPRGLIRYGSQAGMGGEKKKLLRPRVVFYPAILLVLVTVWVLVFAGKGEADVSLLRNVGSPYVRLGEGRVGDPMRVKIVNRTEHDAIYRLELMEPVGATIEGGSEIKVAAGQMQTAGFLVSVPEGDFRNGMAEGKFRVSTVGTNGEVKVVKEVSAALLGPVGITTGARL